MFRNKKDNTDTVEEKDDNVKKNDPMVKVHKRTVEEREINPKYVRTYGGMRTSLIFIKIGYTVDGYVKRYEIPLYDIHIGTYNNDNSIDKRVDYDDILFLTKLNPKDIKYVKWENE